MRWQQEDSLEIIDEENEEEERSKRVSRIQSAHKEQKYDGEEEEELGEEEELYDDEGMATENDDLHNGYQSDEEVLRMDDEKNKLLQQQNSGKKRHLAPQETISDADFYMQRFDAPGIKNLSKQDSVIQEEDEPSYGLVPEMKLPLSRVPSIREVYFHSNIDSIPFAYTKMCSFSLPRFSSATCQ